MSPRKPRPAPFVGYQPARRDRPPVTLYLPIRKTELTALLKSDSATLRKLGERVVAEVAAREQEEIDKLHAALRRTARLNELERERRAALTEDQRKAEDDERAELQRSVAAMFGGLLR